MLRFYIVVVVSSPSSNRKKRCDCASRWFKSRVVIEVARTFFAGRDAATCGWRLKKTATGHKHTQTSHARRGEARTHFRAMRPPGVAQRATAAAA